jgi:hypothetical protein
MLSVETVATVHGIIHERWSPPACDSPSSSRSARAAPRPVPDTTGARTAHHPTTLWRGSATMRSQPTYTCRGTTPRDTPRR